MRPQPDVVSARPTVAPRHVREQLAAIGITNSVLGLCLIWVVAFGPIVQPLFHAGAPRMALTDAIVAHHDVKIDDYLIGVDFVRHDGHTYSDKAVGQELLAIPLYVAGRAVGAESSQVPRVTENLTLWWVTLWSAGLPLMAIGLMMAVATSRRSPRLPLPALAGLMFGTMLLPYSVTLYGHALAAALGFGAWLVFDGDDHPRGRAWLAGCLVGVAVLVEYQAAIVAVALLVAYVLRRSWKPLVRFVIAGVPFGVVMLGYQTLAYGSPFRSGYDEKPVHEAATFFITGLPNPATAWSFLFGSRGMLVFTPIVTVGLSGLVVRWRRHREEGVGVAITVCVGFLLLQAGWVNPWGGESPGPRYVIPMLPFLAFGLAEVWKSVPGPIRRGVLVVSFASMVLPSVTEHLMGSGSIMIVEHLGRLLRDGPEPTLFTMALGPVGWLLHLGLIALAVRWTICAAPSRTDPATLSTVPAEPRVLNSGS